MKRTLHAAGALLAAGGLLATSACGGSSGQESGGKTTVTVMTWESNATNKLIDQALAGFQDPDITVKRIDTPNGNYSDKLSALTQAKKLPDLFWCGNDTEQQYTGQGLLTDWSSKLSGSGDFGTGSFDATAMKNWKTADGRIGGVLADEHLWHLVRHRRLQGSRHSGTRGRLDLGPDVRGRRQAARERRQVRPGRRRHDRSRRPFSLSLYSQSAGGAPFTDDVHHPTKVTVDATYTEGVSKLVAGIKSGAVAPPGYDISNQQSLFSAGEIPMLWSGQWLAAGFLTDKPKIKYGFAPCPRPTSRPRCTTPWASAPLVHQERGRHLQGPQVPRLNRVDQGAPRLARGGAGLHPCSGLLLQRPRQGGADDRRLHRQDGSEGLVHHRRALHHPVGQPGRRPDHGVLARHPPGQEAAVRSAVHGRQDQRSDQEQRLGVRRVHGRRASRPPTGAYDGNGNVS